MKTKVLFLIGLMALLGRAFSEDRYIFQVFLNKPEDRSRIAASGLSPYALMKNSIIAEGTQSSAVASGLAFRTLLPAPAPGPFYLIFCSSFDKQAVNVRSHIAAQCTILAEDSNVFFVQADPERAESLLPLQVNVLRVWMKAIDLGLSPPLISPRAVAYDSVIQWIIDQITPAEISGMLRDLSGERSVMVRGREDTIRTRDHRTFKNSSAIWYFYEKASSYIGQDSVAFHAYSWSRGVDSNVVVTKVGRVYPRQQFLVGGHIDSRSEQSLTFAPGADDNGSGAVAVLIAAKVSRLIPFKRTIKYIAFNTEEGSGAGSNAIASEARARGDSILGLLNADMIGTNYTRRDSVEISHGGRIGSMFLADRFNQIDTTYHLGLNVQITSEQYGSDQLFFWWNGYEAAAVHENDFSTYWHTSFDRITAMDTVYWTKVVKCLVATLCDLAEPDTFFIGVEEPSTSQLTNLIRPLSISPNPFTSFTTLPGHASELFSLYDISGRKVGVYKGNKVGLDVSPGIYFLRPDTRSSLSDPRVLRIVKLR